MRETAFIITIDTEGDDLWAAPHTITTRNARYLPRFQALCERYGLKPVYLTNYEMAVSDAFVEFGRDVLARGAAEIGMHLHAWNSPPIWPLTSDDFHHQPYLIEYPDHVMEEKIEVLTRLLEERFDEPMVSHRSGRWAFDGRYAALLIAAGYRVDCSVTPGVDWRSNPGAPGGRGGSDYTGFPAQPYVVDTADISRPAGGGLLEVPMTVHTSELFRKADWAYRTPLLSKVANRASPRLRWLCPAPLLESANLDAMLQVYRAELAEEPAHLEFMMHSSELMPGGSPGFRTASDIERLYEYLEVLFEEASRSCTGVTLKEFASRFERPSVASRAAASSLSPPGSAATILPRGG
jgi:hypothetical protein